MKSSQIWMSSFSSWINPSEPENVSLFSFSCGLAAGVTQIMDLKVEKFDIFFFTSKYMDRKQKSPETVVISMFEWLLINLNSPPLYASLCQIFCFPPTWNN